MTTNYQKSQINLIVDYLDVPFEGDIENSEEVEQFIDLYFDDAAAMYEELRCEYEANYLD